MLYVIKRLGFLYSRHIFKATGYIVAGFPKALEIMENL